MRPLEAEMTADLTPLGCDRRAVASADCKDSAMADDNALKRGRRTS
jgi:hypothetical protein